MCAEPVFRPLVCHATHHVLMHTRCCFQAKPIQVLKGEHLRHVCQMALACIGCVPSILQLSWCHLGCLLQTCFTYQVAIMSHMHSSKHSWFWMCLLTNVYMPSAAIRIATSTRQPVLVW